MSDTFLTEGLNSVERDILLKALQEIDNIKKNSTEARLIRPIVPIEKWLEDPYYVGPDGLRLYPYWKKVMCEIFKEDSNINLIVVQGSIGTGKSTMGVFCMVRKLYELSCYENVLAMFKLMSTSSLIFIYFSLSQTQAQVTGFGQFRSLVDSIPYFQQCFQRNERLNSTLLFPEKIVFKYGSNSSHMIGQNVLGAILDEANFHGNDGTQDVVKGSTQQSSNSAQHLFGTIINRQSSRFQNQGKNPTLSILISSSTHAGSVTENIIKQYRNDPTCMIVSGKLWDVKPKGTYSDHGFYVFAGSDMMDPQFLDSVADFNLYRDTIGLEPSYAVSLEQAYEEIPSNLRYPIVWVPDDFRRGFELDLITSLQDIAGYSVAPTGRLFTARPLYYKSIDPSLSHPFTKHEIIAATQSQTQIWQYLKKGFDFKDKEKPHFIHIDQSTSNDATGIAMAHVSDVVEEGDTRKPVITIDFQLRINPPKKPRQISIQKVIDFIFYLRDTMYVNIELVTYDQFASAMAIQVLQDGGFNAERLSVDRTDEQYLAYTNLIYEERLRQYEYPVGKAELFDLMWDRARHKVDHPPVSYSYDNNGMPISIGGTKDVSDAIAGCIWNALQAPLPSFGEVASNLVRINSDDYEDELITIDELLSDFDYSYDGYY